MNSWGLGPDCTRALPGYPRRWTTPAGGSSSWWGKARRLLRTSWEAWLISCDGDLGTPGGGVHPDRGIFRTAGPCAVAGGSWTDWRPSSGAGGTVDENAGAVPFQGEGPGGDWSIITIRRTATWCTDRTRRGFPSAWRAYMLVGRRLGLNIGGNGRIISSRAQFRRKIVLVDCCFNGAGCWIESFLKMQGPSGRRRKLSWTGGLGGTDCEPVLGNLVRAYQQVSHEGEFSSYADLLRRRSGIWRAAVRPGRRRAPVRLLSGRLVRGIDRAWSGRIVAVGTPGGRAGQKVHYSQYALRVMQVFLDLSYRIGVEGLR